MIDRQFIETMKMPLLLMITGAVIAVYVVNGQKA